MHSKAACAHLKRMNIIIKAYDFPAYVDLVLDGRCVYLCYAYSVLFPSFLFFLLLSLSLSLSSQNVVFSSHVCMAKH